LPEGIKQPKCGFQTVTLNKKGKKGKKKSIEKTREPSRLVISWKKNRDTHKNQYRTVGKRQAQKIKQKRRQC